MHEVVQAPEGLDAQVVLVCRKGHVLGRGPDSDGAALLQAHNARQQRAQPCQPIPAICPRIFRKCSALPARRL